MDRGRSCSRLDLGTFRMRLNFEKINGIGPGARIRREALEGEANVLRRQPTITPLQFLRRAIKGRIALDLAPTGDNESTYDSLPHWTRTILVGPRNRP